MHLSKKAKATAIFASNGDAIFFLELSKKHKNPEAYAQCMKKAFLNDSAALNSRLSYQILQISKIARANHAESNNQSGPLLRPEKEYC